MEQTSVLFVIGLLCTTLAGAEPQGGGGRPPSGGVMPHGAEGRQPSGETMQNFYLTAMCSGNQSPTCKREAKECMDLLNINFSKGVSIGVDMDEMCPESGPDSECATKFARCRGMLNAVPAGPNGPMSSQAPNDEQIALMCSLMKATNCQRKLKRCIEFSQQPNAKISDMPACPKIIQEYMEVSEELAKRLGEPGTTESSASMEQSTPEPTEASASGFSPNVALWTPCLIIIIINYFRLNGQGPLDGRVD